MQEREREAGIKGDWVGGGGGWNGGEFRKEAGTEVDWSNVSDWKEM